MEKLTLEHQIYLIEYKNIVAFLSFLTTHKAQATEICWYQDIPQKSVNTMTTDVFDPCIARSAAVMVLTMHDK